MYNKLDVHTIGTGCREVNTILGGSYSGSTRSPDHLGHTECRPQELNRNVDGILCREMTKMRLSERTSGMRYVCVLVHCIALFVYVCVQRDLRYAAAVEAAVCLGPR